MAYFAFGLGISNNVKGIIGLIGITGFKRGICALPDTNEYALQDTLEHILVSSDGSMMPGLSNKISRNEPIKMGNFLIPCKLPHGWRRWIKKLISPLNKIFDGGWYYGMSV